MTDKFSRTHGSTGTEPPNGKEFQQDERPDESHFDWFWYNVHEKINSIIDELATKASDNHDNTAHSTDYLSQSDQYTDEKTQDAVNALLSGGSSVSLTYDDANDDLTIDASTLSNEEVEDILASLVASDSNLSWSYDDEGDTLTISLADSISVSSLEVTDSITDANGTTHTDELADASDLASETESKGVASGYNRQTQSVTATIAEDSGGGSGQTSVTYTNRVNGIAADMNASFQGSNGVIESINIDVELLADDGSVKSTVNLYNNNAFNFDVDPIFNGISVSTNFTEIDFTDYNILLSVGRTGANTNEDQNMTVSFDPLSFHVVTLPTHKHQLNQ